jgi:ribonuclease HI
MTKKKYYAVKKGKTPGIYLTWDDCKKQVMGFHGAIYKGFATIQEAEDFLCGGSRDEKVSVDEEGKIENLSQGEAAAYVDGSYNNKTKEYSCGVVFFYEGEEKRICRRGEDKELASMRNVAGEILGAELAMREAVRLGAEKLVIFHDYQGIASWCLGEWKTNKEGTKAYKEYYDSLRGTLSVTFQKVKGHSGDKWNDVADELAKSVIF